MKLLILACLAVAAIATPVDPIYPEGWVEIDWSKVVPVTDMPGFWDGREIRPAFYPGDQTRTGRIVGGDIVTPHTHPYQVGLLITFGGGTGLCGGSIVAHNWILTAAHCPIGSSSTQVIKGAHQLTAVEPNQQRSVVPSANYRIHASYNPSNLNNDIAMLLLPSSATLNAFVAASVLPPLGNSDLHVGVLATVSGWGRVSDGSGATSAHLRSVQNNIITNAVCAATYGTSVVVDSVICMQTTGGRGTCNGDSGGPLTVPQGGGRLQVGVVSFGAAAGCEVGFPAGFARVTSHRAWIQTTSGI
jgi:chymotrypsin